MNETSINKRAEEEETGLKLYVLSHDTKLLDEIDHIPPTLVQRHGIILAVVLR
jgi:hypothetical protein